MALTQANVYNHTFQKLLFLIHQDSLAGQLKEENVGVSKQSGFMLGLKVPPQPTSGAFFGRRSNFWSGSNASESDLAHHRRPAQQCDAMVHLHTQQ